MGTLNNVNFEKNQHGIMLITVLVILEAAWGFRVKAKEHVHVCVGFRGKRCFRVAEWTSVVFPHLGLFLYSSSVVLPFVCSSIKSLRLQLETQPNFVSTAVHVLAVNQT